MATPRVLTGGLVGIVISADGLPALTAVGLVHGP